MSPSTHQNVSAAGSSLAAEDLSNSLLSDLAPLLTLFGEQITKQFLSMSMGWTDNMLIALGPLSIMTIIVSTIRVAGVQRSKALIGRARESRATAEAELLQIAITLDRDRPVALPLRQAYKKKFMGEEDFDEMVFSHAPDLSLNSPGSCISQKELWSWVFMGAVLQVSALIIPVILMRHIGQPVRPYGYACYSAGTVAVCVSLAMCSHVIERSTTELKFIPNPAKTGKLQILTLQEVSDVGEQKYSSYIIFCAPNEPQVRMSRFNKKIYR
ncbi:hypothetical protein EK21DRAFT_98492 [Setomelanomma holmii]|uniref:Uncharacterized protein n=1 Tax=Setomelanomma holmii TaxID=210430 RepID=A0A9P4HEN7_9PLEO|nr:hypothetical protein EK21DRAFT_98492 [Setomelanomma holmii]